MAAVVKTALIVLALVIFTSGRPPFGQEDRALEKREENEGRLGRNSDMRGEEKIRTLKKREETDWVKNWCCVHLNFHQRSWDEDCAAHDLAVSDDKCHA